MGEVADDIIEGACCSQCGVYFIDDHGYPVLCNGCWTNASPKERKSFQKATEDEL